MEPKISIVIPTKNEAKVIASGLKQYSAVKDKLGLEIVVSDGGSTDGTQEAAAPYADLIVPPKPGVKQNIPIGRNAGCFAAHGDILFNTDADVVIPDIERFFTEVRKAFEDPTVVGAMTPIKIYPQEEHLNDKLVHAIFNGSIKLTNRFFGSFWSKGECQFVRASAFRKIGGYNEGLVVGEDCDMFFRLAKTGKVAYLDDLVVYHSPRRFRQEGYASTLWTYVQNGFSLYVLGKTHSKEWSVVR